MTGVRMPRRPLHPGPPLGFWGRVGHMLKDWHTWSTLGYLLLMLPLGILYFVVAVVGLALSVGFILAPLTALADRLGWWWPPGSVTVNPDWFGNPWMLPFVVAVGVLLLTTLMHVARGVGRLHASFAKVLLVDRAAA
jgi:Putative sensor